ncbi:NAD(P)/FAD-dependent oxidoreductase [Actomonas aquatica]|uniref:FAD-dependent monooxygenase n=1 Tax=Actomonas aquatica TaxID=2866162 RepID=A0ABZ1C589_9BACT|nr:FAD-dependent oxidoreductase [Opitutus sp. WL0086]WRQ86508.1 FAD-dependent monooxygenase [Opitutus sp. WL0086]
MSEPSENLVDITLPLASAEQAEAQRKAIVRKLRIAPDRLRSFRLRKRSIDARKKEIKLHLRFEVGLDTELPVDTLPSPEYPQVPARAIPVVIVGAGPAGLFAALRLIERGFKPIILERGKDASSRRFDLAPILRQGRVIEDSNYCFGEGGAGTFSDGKLYTRATKRGPVADIYKTFVAHGAPPEILIDAHPHIGSNLLPSVVMAMRESITRAGGEVHFNQRVTDFELQNDRTWNVSTHTDQVLNGGAVILATGHSARDIYSLLHAKDIYLEAKPFAVGVRIEHPQSLIDQRQYHLGKEASRPDSLPAANYRLATKIDNRGVHSFCMCPGGFIVPAATENDEIVVNGMSLSRRDSYFANSGFVVTVEPEDTIQFAPQHGILAGVSYQKHLERAAKLAGGGGQKAPAQLALDFLKSQPSSNLNRSSYFPGLTSARLDELLPSEIVYRLKGGLRLFNQQLKGFTSPEAQLIGVETRTSSPIRIPRDSQNLEHPQLPRFYPCGEGAGYAGGIVSAAMDGLKIAEQVARSLANNSA